MNFRNRVLSHPLLVRRPQPSRFYFRSAVLLRVELAAFPRALYRDPYEVLGLPKNATTEQIKKAYKPLIISKEAAKKFHPDLNKTDPRATEKFQEAKEAYEILMDPNKKARYYMGWGADDFAASERQQGAGSSSASWQDASGPFGRPGEENTRLTYQQPPFFRPGMGRPEGQFGFGPEFGFGRVEMSQDGRSWRFTGIGPNGSFVFTSTSTTFGEPPRFTRGKGRRSGQHPDTGPEIDMDMIMRGLSDLFGDFSAEKRSHTAHKRGRARNEEEEEESLWDKLQNMFSSALPEQPVFSEAQAASYLPSRFSISIQAEPSFHMELLHGKTHYGSIEVAPAARPADLEWRVRGKVIASAEYSQTLMPGGFEQRIDVHSSRKRLGSIVTMYKPVISSLWPLRTIEAFDAQDRPLFRASRVAIPGITFNFFRPDYDHAMARASSSLFTRTSLFEFTAGPSFREVHPAFFLFTIAYFTKPPNPWKVYGNWM